MEKCGEYGRDKLTIWKSPLLFPKVDGEEGSKSGFLDQQVTSIVWILQRFLGQLPRLKVLNPETDEFFPDTKEDKQNRNKLRGPKFSGGILADSMGLGKTLSCIACLELMAGHKLNYTPGGKTARWEEDQGEALSYGYPSTKCNRCSSMGRRDLPEHRS